MYFSDVQKIIEYLVNVPHCIDGETEAPKWLGCPKFYPWLMAEPIRTGTLDFRDSFFLIKLRIQMYYIG